MLKTDQIRCCVFPVLFTRRGSPEIRGVLRSSFRSCMHPRQLRECSLMMVSSSQVEFLLELIFLKSCNFQFIMHQILPVFLDFKFYFWTSRQTYSLLGCWGNFSLRICSWILFSVLVSSPRSETTWRRVNPAALRGNSNTLRVKNIF